MAIKATFLRQQEALARDRASVATLPNVRLVATRAALAWGREASRAERIELKSGLARAACAPVADADRQHSENPDRTFAA